jgi:hypothetical protein
VPLRIAPRKTVGRCLPTDAVILPIAAGQPDLHVLQLLADLQRQLVLGHVGGIQANIEGAARHPLGATHRMQEAIRHVANVHEVAFEIFLKQYEVAVRESHVREVIHK